MPFQLKTLLGAVLLIGVTFSNAANAKSFAYVGGDDDNIYVIEQQSKAITATIPTSACTGYGIAISPDGTRAYISTACGNALEVIDTNTNQKVKEIPLNSPQGVALSLDGHDLYVATVDGVVVFDIDTMNNFNVVTTVGAGVFSGQGLAITPDGKKIYATDGDYSVYVIDTSNNQLLLGGQPISIPQIPNFNSGAHQIAITPNGSKVYVTSDGWGNSDVVTVIDTQSDQVITSIPVGEGSIGVVASPDSTSIYVSNYWSTNVSLIDTNTEMVSMTLLQNQLPGAEGMDITSDGKELWVASRNSGQVLILDTLTQSLKTTITALGQPIAHGRFLGPELCGNGHLEDLSAGEECDDGGTIDGNGCSHDCKKEMGYQDKCGDAIITSPEECDQGIANSDSGSCTTSCKIAKCGDGLIETGIETCDDGNTVSGDGCDTSCQLESGWTCSTPGMPCVKNCGNGVIDLGEQCDDGNLTNGDCCNDQCQFEGTAQSCDDGNVNTNQDHCDGAGKCVGTPILPPPPPAQEICNNGIDDDNNGLVDCQDPACAQDPACSNPNQGSTGTDSDRPANPSPNGSGCSLNHQTETPAPLASGILIGFLGMGFVALRRKSRV